MPVERLLQQPQRAAASAPEALAAANPETRQITLSRGGELTLREA